MGQLIDKGAFERGVRNQRFVLETGQILSPSALDLARERGIEIVRSGSSQRAMPQRALEIEALSERITRRLMQAGHQPGPALVDAVAAEVGAIQRGEKGAASLVDNTDSAQMKTCLNCGAHKVDAGRERVVITSAGRNRTGVVAGLATAVAEMRADILDISQTLVGEYFTMIMVIDIGATSTSFEQMRNRLLDDAKRLGIQVNVMHDDLLKAMHRV